MLLLVFQLIFTKKMLPILFIRIDNIFQTNTILKEFFKYTD
ncbi:hypothetical protein SAMN05192550_1916 [Flavobacterium glycines]|uniref:Uncharacterized protein n=1 Tax=Flavobacterium glycines TaxID=551990 RepID=A0A1G8SUB5_9FLAO|nr:hypothetical protein SAMN05192550_1916 [Flavobacterium glycines]